MRLSKECKYYLLKTNRNHQITLAVHQSVEAISLHHSYHKRENIDWKEMVSPHLVINLRTSAKHGSHPSEN